MSTKSFGSNHSQIKYSPITDNPPSDFRTDMGSMEAGLTPVEDGSGLYTNSKSQLSNGTGKHGSGMISNGTPKRIRTLSVDGMSQTANGAVATLPSLHIPGESGELADMSAEMKHSDEIPATGIAPEKLKQVYAQIKAKKIKYKLILATSVISLLMIAYASVLFPWFLPYYHTIVFPILILIRIVVYTKMHWGLFCLDFCYFANTGLLVFVWAFPQNEAVFAVMFGVTCGPVAIAILVFRNSLVYHDYDRMTSAYIHLMPNLVVYLLKWFPAETSKFWYFSPHTFSENSMYDNSTTLTTSYLPHWVDPTWLWIVAVPLMWFTVHTILFMVLENTCFDDKKYLTSYKWLSTNSKSAIYHLLTLGGRVTNQTKVKISWVLFNLLYGIVSVLVARLCWEFQIAHTIYVILQNVIAIYNGASFYIDVFAKKGLGVKNG